MSETDPPMNAPKCEDVEPGTYWWCTCGKSAGQPYCDGSHAGSGRSPLEVTIAAPQSVAWCCCKQTKTPPFCDGTHKTL